MEHSRSILIDDKPYGIVFIPPFHGNCVTGKAQLGHLENKGVMLDLHKMGIEMPDRVSFGNRIFEYSGVSDGIAYYKEV